jgi:phosphoadenosine phosphosulfate reductase
MYNVCDMKNKETITIEFLREKIALYNSQNRNIYFSSSFQTQSVPLLHIIHRNFPEIKVLFIDTGFLFIETQIFRDELIRRLRLRVVTIGPGKSGRNERDQYGRYMYETDPDKCCEVNKVEPLMTFLQEGDVWISGIRQDQTKTRNKIADFVAKKKGVIRIYPMLEWAADDILNYIDSYDLPVHPLFKSGYSSIGCEPCTVPANNFSSRKGRWPGLDKFECGLHDD